LHLRPGSTTALASPRRRLRNQSHEQCTILLVCVLTTYRPAPTWAQPGLTMVNYRTVLAGLIALAVAVAPISTALVAAPAATVAVTHDCHGNAPKDANKTNCPDCDSQRQANCPGDGSKCCKLTGTIAALPVLIVTAAAIDSAADPRESLGWQLGPRPPPPRT
jgi:hypothetical protein